MSNRIEQTSCKPALSFGLSCCLALFGGVLASCGSPDNDTHNALARDTAKTAESTSTVELEKLSYAVGDIYDDGEFRARYLGLARLSLGKDSVWRDGDCYALLVEVSWYNDHSKSRLKDTFTPSTKGVLTGGGEADRDESGVDCDSKPLRELGYQRTHKAKLAMGESAKVWTGAFHVPGGEGPSLEGARLYNGKALFEPEITVNATRDKAN